MVFSPAADAELRGTEFYTGPIATVRVDANGNAFVIGLRGQTSSPEDYRFRSTPDLTGVKKAAVGYETIWFLKANGEIWRMGLRAEKGVSSEHTFKPRQERPASLYSNVLEKLDLPLMTEMTATNTRVGGLSQTGEAWAWAQTGDFGSDYSRAAGWKMSFPGKIRQIHFDIYEQTIIEDDKGQLWGRSVSRSLDAPMDLYSSPFEKLKIDGDQKLEAIGNQILATRSSADGKTLRLYSWHRDLGSKAGDSIFTSERSITLPFKADEFVIEKERIVAVAEGKVFDLPYKHWGEDLRLTTWQERRMPEPIARIWADESHEFFQSKSGAFYSAGENKYGELGFPFLFEQPIQLKALTSIVSIASASNSNFAVDSSGSLYSWGSGQNLGVLNETLEAPTKVACPSLVKVAADVRKGLGLTSSGEVYVWGSKSEYVPQGFRSFFESKLSGLRGKKKPESRTPVKIRELDKIVNVDTPNVSSYKYTGRALDSKNRLWVWRAVDLSNPFEAFFPSFEPPHIHRQLNSNEREIFDFSYDHKITWMTDGSLIGEPGKYDFLIKNIASKATGDRKIQFELPPVSQVHQLADDTLALLFRDGTLAKITAENYEVVAKDVAKIFKARGTLLVLKKDGTFSELFSHKAPRTYRLSQSEVDSIDEITSGEGHYMLRKSDGSVWVWGQNDKNQLGLKDTGPSLTPRKLQL